MAKDFKGMSVQDIRGLNTQTLSTSELRRATQKMVDAANKRIDRMLKDPAAKNFYWARKAAEEGGKAFSTKGRTTRAEVKAEFDKLRGFFDPAKQSTSVRGAAKIAKTFEEKGLTKEQIRSSDFWAKARRMMEELKGQYSSDEVLLAVAEMDGEDDWDEFDNEDMFEDEWDEDILDEDVEGRVADATSPDDLEGFEDRLEKLKEVIRKRYEESEKQEDFMRGLDDKDFGGYF